MFYILKVEDHVRVEPRHFGLPTHEAIEKQLNEDFVDSITKELGYVMYPALRRGIKNRELFVAEYGRRIVGFCNWHRRQDGWSVVYDIAVHKDCLQQGIGRGLLAGIPKPIRLKCPVDNMANGFYEHIGFSLKRLEKGRNRSLNVWEMIK